MGGGRDEKEDDKKGGKETDRQKHRDSRKKENDIVEGLSPRQISGLNRDSTQTQRGVSNHGLRPV